MRFNHAASFFAAVLGAQLYSRKANKRLSDKLSLELDRRQARDELPPREVDLQLLHNKFMRFRPRLIGAVGAYCLLSGQHHPDVVQNGGLDLFRTMWYLGATQDDLIDEIPSQNGIERRHVELRIRDAMFGTDRTIYRAALRVFSDDLSRSDFPPEAQQYLRRKVRDWYRFLVEQEAKVLTMHSSELGYWECRRYREEQNMRVAKLLTACLNGRRCHEPEMQVLETLVPMLSFRTQIIDDVADVFEDLAMGRPSFCMGALNDNPHELHNVREFARKNPRVKKMQVQLFRKLAPKSASLIESTYDQYGADLRTRSEPFVLLATVGDMLYRWFPTFRDAIYRLQPRWANF